MHYPVRLGASGVPPWHGRQYSLASGCSQSPKLRDRPIRALIAVNGGQDEPDRADQPGGSGPMCPSTLACTSPQSFFSSAG